jgi:uncharacterized Fe-S center protein
MKSNVYFIDLRASAKESLVEKLARLLDTAGLSEAIKERDLVAVKLHFGEKGNTAFIRPVFILYLLYPASQQPKTGSTIFQILLCFSIKSSFSSLLREY